MLKGIGLTSNWINSKPIKYENIIGKVVLVDFWTYSCINCIRTIPQLNELQKKYAKKGLVVIGIHTPEFDFEKDERHVKDAIKKLKIKYPVATDNDYSVWNYFSNSYWPRQYIFDQNGELAFDHIGEGGYDEIERQICELLGLELRSSQEYNHPETEEAYFGSLKHTGFGNAQICRPGVCITYRDQDQHDPNRPYLHGQWIQNPDSLKMVSSGYVAINYIAKECNIVASGKCKCIVTLNGKYLTKENKGEDVKINSKGVSFISIDKPRMYNIIKTKTVQTNEIKIIPDNNTFEIFTFTSA